MMPHDPDNNLLPPRIVIELPDGNVALGEDSCRLDDERAASALQVELAQNLAALPVTVRDLSLRRILYASALDSVVAQRKQHAIVLLGASLSHHFPTARAHRYECMCW
jgi:hypothetical protein